MSHNCLGAKHIAAMLCVHGDSGVISAPFPGACGIWLAETSYQALEFGPVCFGLHSVLQEQCNLSQWQSASGVNATLPGCTVS